MSFNELNSVEHYIIHQISGVNLNNKGVSEPVSRYGVQWEYKSAQEITRTTNEVLVETELKEALIRGHIKNYGEYVIFEKKRLLWNKNY